MMGASRNWNNWDRSLVNGERRDESPIMFHSQLIANAQCMARVEVKYTDE